MTTRKAVRRAMMYPSIGGKRSAARLRELMLRVRRSHMPEIDLRVSGSYYSLFILDSF